MLLNLKELIREHNLQIKGILHIGAHIGQEYETYQSLNINNHIFFEPVKSTFEKLKTNIGHKTTIVNTALGNTTGETTINIETANNGQSNSILKPHHHLIIYPHIQFKTTETIKITTLDTYMENHNRNDYNLINIDTQGYELEVLKGSKKQLTTTDYIITEINQKEMYKNCPTTEEIDQYLEEYNFKRITTTIIGNNWGEALYIKLKTRFNIKTLTSSQITQSILNLPNKIKMN